MTEKAIFRDVRIIQPMAEHFTPYRDFIGSVLEVLDLQSGNSQILMHSRQPIEAPNWTRDGAALIYNVSGRAAGWGALAGSTSPRALAAPIDTGTANRNNNDHVLSFDGSMLGISDQSASGQSAVSIVPWAGAPRGGSHRSRRLISTVGRRTGSS